MKLKTLLIATTLFITSNSASAVNWVYVTEGEKSTVYIDTDSLVRKKNTIEVWQLIDCTEYQYTSEYPSKKYLSLKDYCSYNFTERTSDVLSISLYSDHFGGGESIESHDFPRSKNPSRIIPGTVGERIMEFVSKPIKKSKTKYTPPKYPVEAVPVAPVIPSSPEPESIPVPKPER